MFRTITVKGKASGKELLNQTIPKVKNTGICLMDYLRNNSLPIASSCLGEGVCQKCLVHLNKKKVLSCQVMVSEIENDDIFIEVDYL